MTMERAIEIHKASGKHFFDEDTMEFWGTEIVSDLLDGDIFITKDDNFDRSKKLYSIRQFTDDYTNVETLSFQKTDSFETAMEIARLVA